MRANPEGNADTAVRLALAVFFAGFAALCAIRAMTEAELVQSRVAQSITSKLLVVGYLLALSSLAFPPGFMCRRAKTCWLAACVLTSIALVLVECHRFGAAIIGDSMADAWQEFVPIGLLYLMDLYLTSLDRWFGGASLVAQPGRAGPLTTDEIAGLLRSPSAGQREAAALALGDRVQSASEAISLLLAASGDHARAVRRAAMLSLVSLLDESEVEADIETLQTFVEHLSDVDLPVRMTAAAGLCKHGSNPDQFVPVLEELAEGQTYGRLPASLVLCACRGRAGMYLSTLVASVDGHGEKAMEASMALLDLLDWRGDLTPTMLDALGFSCEKEARQALQQSASELMS